jgi:hypothetical protein
MRTKVTLLNILEDTGTKSFKYLYDFGDGWQHSMKIERVEPALPGNTYPRIFLMRSVIVPQKIVAAPGVI